MTSVATPQPNATNSSDPTDEKSKRATPGPAWFTYILVCADGSFYCGIALDPDARLAAHNAGRGAKYTRGRGPCRVAYLESHPSKGEALKRERAIKNLSRARKHELVERWRTEAIPVKRSASKG